MMRNIVKVLSDLSHANEVSQPYINEMLQAQAIQTDLGPELQKIGFTLPTYLFASVQMGCRSYEPGYEPSNTPEFRKKLDSLASAVYDYRDTHRKDPLWNNIYFDFVDNLIGRVIRTENFVQRPDGVIAWIDPIQYLD